MSESGCRNGVSVDGIGGDGVGIGGAGSGFITQSEVQREIFSDMPVVLEVCGEEVLAECDLMGTSGRERVELVGRIGEELGQGIGVEASVRAELFEDIVVHVLKGSSDFHGVVAFGDECVIVELDRLPVVVELVEPAESVGSGEARDWELRRCDGAGGYSELGVVAVGDDCCGL